MNYVKYSGLIAAGGVISGYMDENGFPNSAFNGFQLVYTIPEPASTSLFVGMALLMTVCARSSIRRKI